jgi:hypothetical protein
MASSNDPAATEDLPGEGDAPGEASLLVSEFPPPPYYYRLAKTLTPPTIPREALERGTKRAAAAASRARAESERLRLGDEADKTDAILGGVSAVEPHEEEEGDVVAVFGEIVEDPLLVEPPDRCEDPTVVRDQVKRLNRQVLQRFVNLVQDLVHRPMDNKYVSVVVTATVVVALETNTVPMCAVLFCFILPYRSIAPLRFPFSRETRDDLSHNTFLMLQEVNKLREHQARELLIELLEKQLADRSTLLGELQTIIAQADVLEDSDL